MKKTNADFWIAFLKNTPETFKKWFYEERKYLQKIITPNSSVLEVGCGNGRSFHDILSKTKNITGIDHDINAVRVAKKNFSKFPEIKIIKAEATDLPFEDNEFDFVICMGTFANFADKKIKALTEMKRVLKKDGKIVISVYSEDAFEERMNNYKASGVLIREVKGTTVIFDESLGDNISEQFSKKELEDIFKKAGLKIKGIKKLNIAYLCAVSKGR